MKESKGKMELVVSYSNARGNGDVLGVYGRHMVCRDGLVHVGLRDYDCQQEIRGLDGKLSYIATCMVNEMLTYADEAGIGRDRALADAVASTESSLGLIVSWVMSKHGIDCSGIKILGNNLRKIDGCKWEGSIADGCGRPSIPHTDLEDMLGDDSYSFEIREARKPKGYGKFLNKYRKPKTQVRDVKLW